MSKALSFGKEVSLKQAAAIIAATPMNRYFLRGSPGIGKSSLIGALKEMFPSYETAYIDVPNMDLGDIAMPVVDHTRKVTSYYPNSRFKLDSGKPVIIMLDEYSKGADPIKNMLHPLLEVKNPRLGDLPIPAGSIIFLTGNKTSDGVGDSLKAHTLNRIITLNIRAPLADEWLDWAVDNNIDPVIMAWVKQFPHCLDEYDPNAKDNNNPYNFNPRRVQQAFVSPRSLEIASNVVKARDKIDTDTLIASLSGAVGEAAARDMQAFVDYQDQLPSWEAIIKEPKKTPVPESAGARAVLVYGAIAKIEKTNMEAFMEYIQRMQPEWQAAFGIQVMKNSGKQAIATSSKSFVNWVARNHDIL